MTILLACASAWGADNPNGIAVIIGNRTYGGGLPPAEYAHNDANATLVRR